MSTTTVFMYFSLTFLSYFGSDMLSQSIKQKDANFQNTVNEKSRTFKHI